MEGLFSKLIIHREKKHWQPETMEYEKGSKLQQQKFGLANKGNVVETEPSGREEGPTARG